MIADNDEDNRCLLKSILELKGFVVLEATKARSSRLGNRNAAGLIAH